MSVLRRFKACRLVYGHRQPFLKGVIIASSKKCIEAYMVLVKGGYQTYGPCLLAPSFPPLAFDGAKQRMHHKASTIGAPRPHRESSHLNPEPRCKRGFSPGLGPPSQSQTEPRKQTWSWPPRQRREAALVWRRFCASGSARSAAL